MKLWLWRRVRPKRTQIVDLQPSSFYTRPGGEVNRTAPLVHCSYLRHHATTEAVSSNQEPAEVP